jgi:hypothetical protein
MAIKVIRSQKYGGQFLPLNLNMFEPLPRALFSRGPVMRVGDTSCIIGEITVCRPGPPNFRLPSNLVPTVHFWVLANETTVFKNNRSKDWKQVDGTFPQNPRSTFLDFQVGAGGAGLDGGGGNVGGGDDAQWEESVAAAVEQACPSANTSLRTSTLGMDRVPSRPVSEPDVTPLITSPSFAETGKEKGHTPGLLHLNEGGLLPAPSPVGQKSASGYSKINPSDNFDSNPAAEAESKLRDVDHTQSITQPPEAGILHLPIEARSAPKSSAKQPPYGAHFLVLDRTIRSYACCFEISMHMIQQLLNTMHLPPSCVCVLGGFLTTHSFYGGLNTSGRCMSHTRASLRFGKSWWLHNHHTPNHRSIQRNHARPTLKNRQQQQQQQQQQQHQQCTISSMENWPRNATSATYFSQKRGSVLGSGKRRISASRALLRAIGFALSAGL